MKERLTGIVTNIDSWRFNWPNRVQERIGIAGDLRNCKPNH
ncbi:hypothetical protein [Haemophilus parainfluenzae]|nr:hypothetical protein [Haemophilus parainfluenzae]